MPSQSGASFEELLKAVQLLPRPFDDTTRVVRWLDDKSVLGVARQASGALELFICGPQLTATLSLVRRNLRFDSWTSSAGGEFSANRLVFPSADHFVPTVAFLGEELIRNGARESTVAAFAATEPLIEMALRRVALTEHELVGLLGELRFLEVLLRVATSAEQRRRSLDSWRGYERDSRDFVFGLKSVEVKTTRGGTSVHSISSVMQVDPRRDKMGEAVEQLFLLSLGFEAIPELSREPGLSLPSQVEIVLRLLDPDATSGMASETQLLFLDKVARYGDDALANYVHTEMRDWDYYGARWRHVFARAYDMNDSNVSVLRRADVQRRAHVVFSSVSFQVDLPERVSGEINPSLDLFELARAVLA